MGTVLLHLLYLRRCLAEFRFSPLLDGDGVASKAVSPQEALQKVSVPFSMGTVLLRSQRQPPSRPRIRFSPLLDGDGVASKDEAAHQATAARFQSPSRWGRCCFSKLNSTVSSAPSVSVPFSMGTVLLLCQILSRRFANFVSVPFSMGTVLLPPALIPYGQYVVSFSPLLDGDGVASTKEWASSPD